MGQFAAASAAAAPKQVKARPGTGAFLLFQILPQFETGRGGDEGQKVDSLGGNARFCLSSGRVTSVWRDQICRLAVSDPANRSCQSR